MTHLILGIVAGTLTTISFVPQVIKLYRTKDAKDLSLITFIIFACGVILWLIYGMVIMEWPIIIANGITLVLTFAIIAMKLKYR